MDGNMYFILKCLYKATEASVLVNDQTTEWFQTLQGVRQGDSLSPTLFSIFLNDLATEIKEMSCGVKFGDCNIGILLYADDVALISENEHNMQNMINCVYKWCMK